HAGATRVVDADDRAPDLDGEIHDGADLLTEALPHRAAEHRVVVRVHDHGATVDRAPAGHHAVTERVVRVAGGLGQLTHLHETAGIEQLRDTHTRWGQSRGITP